MTVKRRGYQEVEREAKIWFSDSGSPTLLSWQPGSKTMVVLAAVLAMSSLAAVEAATQTLTSLMLLRGEMSASELHNLDGNWKWEWS